MKNVLLTLTLCLVAFVANAGKGCLTLEDGVNYSYDDYLSRYCTEEDVVSVYTANTDAIIDVKGNAFTVLTHDAGTLYNIIIELEDGSTQEALFLSVITPQVKRVLTFQDPKAPPVVEEVIIK
ncbi:hypothetical protein [Alteromonas macleodii]|uniref:Uncharacterized protein n=1 Tax=Alteromonas macleodii TaxID=28108 RepID=A0AB36FRN6_ALTMA|nr:hypothetical protein [Alteromonas macleodii]OES24481.1 hypothetical protein BFV95_4748 [Alteromonas macleodii]OES25538.1 hypothetical protein BFV94_4391 [Alteromonas macleodii]OES25839.1 hypothetical protein BFV93_4302 [Alteromonas macleodii]OES38639.1 hypothetical protein BFV96_4750 [Alteromonas macleodii]